MRDARFQIPGPALLAKVVDKIDRLEMGDRDTKGDLYEYMLAKIATAGQNGQFRTPRHIIATMVELVQPKPDDVICDPACGTCGFLVAAGILAQTAALTRDYGVMRIQQYPPLRAAMVRRRNRSVLHRPRRQTGRAGLRLLRGRTPGRRATAKLLTRDEVYRIALNGIASHHV
jgi:hypothetical protein